MSVFKSGLNISVVVVFVLHADFILEELKLAGVEGAVAENISKKANGCFGISLKYLKVVAGELSIRVSRVSGSMVLNDLGQLSLGLVGGSSESHLLEKVRGTCGGKIFVS